MEDKPLTGLFIDNANSTYEARTITDTLEEFYKLLSCDTIDIITRYINGKSYDIVIDDEGKFKEHVLSEAPIRCYNGDALYDVVVGSVFICSDDGEGELVSLSEEEIRELKDSLNFWHRDDKSTFVTANATYYPPDEMRGR